MPKRHFSVPRHLIPSPKKIATRGLFEILSPSSPKRDYSKRTKKGKF